MDKLPLNIADIRRKLAGTSGREYWKGLEEIAERPEFTDYLHDEFPRLAALWERQIDRRTVLKLMAGSVAFATAGLAGCSRPIGEIVPYVNMPEGEIPGEPMYYATSFTLGGYARGVIAESYTGRPTFVEGNKKHPSSHRPGAGRCCGRPRPAPPPRPPRSRGRRGCPSGAPSGRQHGRRRPGHRRQ